MELVARGLGSPMEPAPIATLDDVSKALIALRSDHMLGSCRRPSHELQTTIAAAGRPFIIVRDHPHIALCDLMSQGFNLPTAVREVASSCAALVSLTDLPNGLSLIEAADPPKVIKQIADHLELNVNSRDVHDIAQTISINRDDPTRPSLQELDERDRALVSGAIDPFVRHLPGSELEPITWEPELFLNADVPGVFLDDRAIDIAGEARFLIYGPYIALPSGSWLAKITLGFSVPSGGVGFMVEVASHTAQLACTRVEAATQRILEIDLNFTIENADQAVEIRVASEGATASGWFALGNVMITRAAKTGNTMDEKLYAMVRAKLEIE